MRPNPSLSTSSAVASLADEVPCSSQSICRRWTAVCPGRKRPRVLVVDDHDDTRAMLCQWLDCCGFQGEQAEGGTSALAKIAENLPDAILLDIGLPDFDGCEVCRRLRRNPATASTPIVALTGYGMATEVQKPVTPGATRCWSNHACLSASCWNSSGICHCTSRRPNSAVRSRNDRCISEGGAAATPAASA